MADIKQDQLGTRREFRFRDDDRPRNTHYSGVRFRRRRPAGLVFAAICLVGLLLAFWYFGQAAQQGVGTTSNPAAPTRVAPGPTAPSP